MVQNLSKPLILGHNFLVSKKSLIDYNTNTVTLYHELDAFILHFGNNVDNSIRKIEQVEDISKVFANVEIESTTQTLRLHLQPATWSKSVAR